MTNEEICTCGHIRNAHYEFILNNAPATRCKECDPLKGLGGGAYEMAHDSYMAAMYRASEHEFMAVK